MNDSLENANEENNMPTAEQVNYGMSAYLEKMEQYITKYKEMPEETAKVHARQNLMDTGIIDAEGNLTGFYKPE